MAFLGANTKTRHCNLEHSYDLFFSLFVIRHYSLHTDTKCLISIFLIKLSTSLYPFQIYPQKQSMYQSWRWGALVGWSSIVVYSIVGYAREVHESQIENMRLHVLSMYTAEFQRSMNILFGLSSSRYTNPPSLSFTELTKTAACMPPYRGFSNNWQNEKLNTQRKDKFFTGECVGKDVG